MALIDARRVFRDLPVVHLATTRSDGGPHVIPLWFVWREEAIYVSCRRDSSTWRNVERDPRVTLSFSLGSKWSEYAGMILGGRAEPLVTEHPALRGVMTEWYEKYRLLLTRGGFQDYARQVEAPGMLRIRPDRVASWNHAAAPEPAAEAGGA